MGKLITKEIEFDAAHRVARTDTACRNLHGHRYLIKIELEGNLIESGPQTGMVLDYHFMKDMLMEHVHSKCDHAIILSIFDTKFINMSYDEKLNSDRSWFFKDWFNHVKENIEKNNFWSGTTAFGKTYIIQEYSTAENLAEHFFNILQKDVTERTEGTVKLKSVTIKETPSSSATYSI